MPRKSAIRPSHVSGATISGKYLSRHVAKGSIGYKTSLLGDLVFRGDTRLTGAGCLLQRRTASVFGLRLQTEGLFALSEWSLQHQPAGDRICVGLPQWAEEPHGQIVVPLPTEPVVTLTSLACGATRTDDHEVQVNWTAVAGALGYRVQFYSGAVCSGAQAVFSINTAADTLTYTWTHADGTFSVKVKALGDQVTIGDSAWSNCCAFTFDTTAPVISLEGYACGATIVNESVVVQWTAVPEAAGYRLQLFPEAVCDAAEAVPLATWDLAADVLTKTLTTGDLSGAATYSVRVMSLGDADDIGESDWSNCCSFSTEYDYAVNLLGDSAGAPINYVTCANVPGSEGDLAQIPLTIEFWYQVKDVSKYGNIIRDNQILNCRQRSLSTGVVIKGWEIIFAGWNIASPTFKTAIHFSDLTIPLFDRQITPNLSWHHMAFCFRTVPTNLFRFFYDGALLDEIGFTGSVVSQSTRFDWGGLYNQTSGIHFSAAGPISLDEVMITKADRYTVPFTPAEHFYEDQGDVPAEVLGYWKCDEGTGAVVEDWSTYTRDGAFTNPDWADGVSV